MVNSTSENVRTTQGTVYSILVAISFSHLLNDTIQSLIPSIYPLVKESLTLSFLQLGLITLSFQLTSSILQPVVGFYTDRYPRPYSLVFGMSVSLLGLLALAWASSFAMVLLAVALVGMGSAVFHPEASRVAYLASGGKRGFAQSFFQVGGNAGSAIGPLLAALIVVPYGQSNIVWFSVAAMAAILVLYQVGNWYKERRASVVAKKPSVHLDNSLTLTSSQLTLSLGILLLLIFSKYFYMASMTSFFTFYLIHKFQLSVQAAQFHLFIFLFAIAAGTLIGGPVGDRFGRKFVIWISILGAAPFTLLLPYVNLFWTTVCSVCIGIILASAFSAILVYAQELLPNKVGMISGLFFGFAFGMAGVASALLGWLADKSSLTYVYQVCSYLPLIGLATAFLPQQKKSIII